ncbi:hypothetical protein [Streptomyces sp. x-80]
MAHVGEPGHEVLDEGQGRANTVRQRGVHMLPSRDVATAMPPMNA